MSEKPRNVGMALDGMHKLLHDARDIFREFKAQAGNLTPEAQKKFMEWLNSEAAPDFYEMLQDVLPELRKTLKFKMTEISVNDKKAQEEKEAVEPK